MKKVRLAYIADKHQLRDEQSVTNRYKKIYAGLREELEKQGWLEGKNTPQPAEPVEKETVELTELDSEIIDYTVRKWKESGRAAEFLMLFREAEGEEDEILALEFLQLWLY